MGLKIYIDGKYLAKEDAKVSVFDHGLLYGDGVFEGIRAYNGLIFRLDAHIARLYDSAGAISLDIPVSPEEMKKIVIDSIAVNGLDDAYVRLIITRGVGTLGVDPGTCPEPSIICIAASIALYPKEYYEKGLDVIVTQTRRMGKENLDPGVKSLNYLNNILAKLEANKAGCLEAVMLNGDGTVAECSGDNIFIVNDGALITPDVDSGILRGVTRGAVLELAREAGIDAVERKVSRDELLTADECFLTGTAAEVIPVVKIDSETIGDGLPGEITKLLLDKFQKLVREEGS